MKQMRMIFLLSIVTSAAATLAQSAGSGATASAPQAQPPQTLTSTLDRAINTIEKQVVDAAEAMPEDKFGYRSTPQQRSWGEQILHVAGGNIFLMRFLGAKAASPAIALTDMATFGLKATTKADHLKILADSFDYGEAALKEFSEPALLQPTTGPPWMGPSTRVRMAYDAIAHCQDIYGQMAVYLRLNGIVPPASRRGV